MTRAMLLANVVGLAERQAEGTIGMLLASNIQTL